LEMVKKVDGSFLTLLGASRMPPFSVVEVD